MKIIKPISVEALRNILDSSLAKRPLWFLILLPFFFLLSLLFSFINLIRRHKGYPQKAVDNSPVIAIGNVLLGGTGKTPVVLALLNELRFSQKDICLISRGYGVIESGRWEVGNDSAFLNDENREIAEIASVKSLKIYQGPNKRQSFDLALEEFPKSAIIIDDGFQSFSVPRDKQVLLWDLEIAKEAPFFAAPVGPYREAFPKKIQDFFEICDVNIWSRAKIEDLDSYRKNLLEFLRSIHAPGKHLIACYKNQLCYPVQNARPIDLKSFRPEQGCILTGIARPHRFLNDLRSFLNIDGMRHFLLSDHALPDNNSLCELDKFEVIFCTYKDFFRLYSAKSCKNLVSSKTFIVLKLETSFFDLSGNEALLSEVLGVSKFFRTH